MDPSPRRPITRSLRAVQAVKGDIISPVQDRGRDLNGQNERDHSKDHSKEGVKWTRQCGEKKAKKGVKVNGGARAHDGGRPRPRARHPAATG